MSQPPSVTTCAIIQQNKSCKPKPCPKPPKKPCPRPGRNVFYGDTVRAARDLQTNNIRCLCDDHCLTIHCNTKINDKLTVKKRVDECLKEVVIDEWYLVDECDEKYICFEASWRNNMVKLPDARDLKPGWSLCIWNSEQSTSYLFIKDNCGNFIRVRNRIQLLGPGRFCCITLVDNKDSEGEPDQCGTWRMGADCHIADKYNPHCGH